MLRQLEEDDDGETTAELERIATSGLQHHRQADLEGNVAAAWQRVWRQEEELQRSEEQGVAAAERLRVGSLHSPVQR